MPTRKDQDRVAAFRAWLEHVGGIEHASIATGIGSRTLERMRAGKQPPPARLLDELAIGATEAGATELGRLLAGAARPAAGAPHA